MADLDHDHFMGLALDEAQASHDAGNIAVGSVIVLDGEVVGRGRNWTATHKDPLSHAEVDAIRDACKRLGRASLAGATLYSVAESCPMCLWAIHESGIDRLVLGARHMALGITRFGDYTAESMIDFTKSNLQLLTGVREAECVAMRGKAGGYLIER